MHLYQSKILIHWISKVNVLIIYSCTLIIYIKGIYMIISKKNYIRNYFIWNNNIIIYFWPIIIILLLIDLEYDILSHV